MNAFVTGLVGARCKWEAKGLKLVTVVQPGGALMVDRTNWKITVLNLVFNR